MKSIHFILDILVHQLIAFILLRHDIKSVITPITEESHIIKFVSDVTYKIML